MYSRSLERRLVVALLFLASVVGALALAHPAAATCPQGGCTGGDPPPISAKTLTVSIVGTGTVSNGAAQVCTAATSPCALTYDSGDSVSLSATAGTRYVFSGWSGDCTGSSTCDLDMITNKSVTATFTHTTPGLPTITYPAANAPTLDGPSQSISFTGGTGATSTRCKVDSSTLPSAGNTCVSPWSTGALATGYHTVYVWSVDADGYMSAYTSRTFKIVDRPDTTLGGTPAEGTVVNTLTTAFTWSSSTGGTAFSCMLDGLLLPSCSSDLSAHLSDGAHTLNVSAGISPFGDGTTYFDTTPATRHWTIDTHAPDTSLSGGPTGTTTERAATFGFGGADPAPGTALHFQCRLDGAAWGPCDSSSGRQYSNLAAGSHTFDVRAVDAAGNADATPASRSWTVIVDADGDGFYSNTDCNDSNASVHPGATDVPGDGIDQDCSGADTPLPPASPSPSPTTPSRPRAAALAAKLRTSFKVAGTRTLVRKLVVSGVPDGAKVKISCRGRGCPFKSKTFRPKHGSVSLTKLFRHRKLANRARLSITVTMPGAKAQAFTISMRSGKKPRLKAG